MLMFLRLDSFLETKINRAELRNCSMYRVDDHVSKDVARTLFFAFNTWNHQPFMPNRAALCDVLNTKRRTEDKEGGSEPKKRRMT
jgi:hypothetical protein